MKKISQLFAITFLCASMAVLAPTNASAASSYQNTSSQTSQSGGILGAISGIIQDIWGQITGNHNSSGNSGNSGSHAGSGNTSSEPRLPINNGLVFLLVTGAAGGVLVLRKRNIEAQA